MNALNRCRPLIIRHLSSRATSQTMARVINLKEIGHDNAVQEAVTSLQAGNVIAVPTDTVYGVAAMVQDINAVRKLYQIKGRNPNKPLPMCVGKVQDLYKWSNVTVNEQVLNDLLPGPVTLVFQRKPELNPELNNFTDIVGIRIPGHPFIQEVAAGCDSPIALTSANISDTRSTLCVKEFETLWKDLDLVFDGGVIGDSDEARLGSTVINLSVPGQFTIIRPGCAYQRTVDLLKNKYNLKETER